MHAEDADRRRGRHGSGRAAERRAGSTAALHGLTRTLVANMVEGVTNGLREAPGDRRGRLPRRAEGHGPRGRARVLPPGARRERPTGSSSRCPRRPGSWCAATTSSRSGEIAANIRKIRKPEPYKGKGIRYERRVRAEEGRQGSEGRCRLMDAKTKRDGASASARPRPQEGRGHAPSARAWPCTAPTGTSTRS